MILVSADPAGSNVRKTDRRPDRSTQIYEIHAIRVIAEKIFALHSITPATNLREVAINSGPFGFASVQDSAGSVRDSRQTNSVRAEELYFWNLLGDSMISNLRPFASVELDMIVFGLLAAPPWAPVQNPRLYWQPWPIAR